MHLQKQIFFTCFCTPIYTLHKITVHAVVHAIAIQDLLFVVKTIRKNNGEQCKGGKLRE